MVHWVGFPEESVTPRSDMKGSTVQLVLFVSCQYDPISYRLSVLESMSMTKAHKEIALFLVQLADRESVTETQIIREVAEKTQELLAHLRFVTVSLFGTKLPVEWKTFC